MLKDRRTKLKFDDYESSWAPIDNGIGQGDPLSMILHLFYNADLLDTTTSRDQSAVTFVDDANLYAEGNTFEEAYSSLDTMLTKQGGVRVWTISFPQFQVRKKRNSLSYASQESESPTPNTSAKQC